VSRAFNDGPWSTYLQTVGGGRITEGTCVDILVAATSLANFVCTCADLQRLKGKPVGQQHSGYDG